MTTIEDYLAINTDHDIWKMVDYNSRMVNDLDRRVVELRDDHDYLAKEFVEHVNTAKARFEKLEVEFTGLTTSTQLQIDKVAA